LDFRQAALKHRYILLLALRTIRKRQGEGAANTIYEITQLAIRSGYVEPRAAPAGEMLERWIKNQNPPAWPLKSAAILLARETEYMPRNEQEKAAFALTFAEAMPDKNAQHLHLGLCLNLQKIIDISTLEKACELRREGQKKQ
jgi:hypothetical protein